MTAAVTWTSVVDYEDIRYEHSGTGIARVTIDRPEVHNAFRPETVAEMIDAFARIRDDASIGCALLTGAGDKAFCSGGDQRFKDRGGYVGGDGLARLNVLDLQRQIRSLPIPVIALVNGYAIGGGQVLQVVCDLAIAGDNAIFGQVGPQVGSFDAGFGIGLLARLVGDRKAKEIWFLCRRYSAAEALEMGLVNRVVPLAELEAEGVALGARDPGHEPDGDPLPQVGLPGGHRRPGRAPGVRGQRDRAVLHDRRGARGIARVPREAAAGLLALPAAPMTSTTAGRRPGAADGLPDLAAGHPSGDAAGGAERRGRGSRGGPRGRHAVPARRGDRLPRRRAPAPDHGQPRQRPVRLPQGRRHARPDRVRSGSPRPGS